MYKRQLLTYKAALDSLPKSFTAKLCGEAAAKGHKQRVACLDRIKLNAPELPVLMRVRWPSFVQDYSKYLARVHLKNVGVFFIKEVNALVVALGTFCKTSTLTDKSGDELALEKYMKEKGKLFSTSASKTVYLPGPE